MPLIQSASKEAIGKNIATEQKKHPHKQAVAIALETARENGADIPKKNAAETKPVSYAAEMHQNYLKSCGGH